MALEPGVKPALHSLEASFLPVDGVEVREDSPRDPLGGGGGPGYLAGTLVPTQLPLFWKKSPPSTLGLFCPQLFPVDVLKNHSENRFDFSTFSN